MQALKAIYDGRAFVPVKPVALARNQVVVLTYTKEKPAAQAPRFSKARIAEWAHDSALQSLAGILEGAALPGDITMKDIRDMRLGERYGL
ncbi:MAG: hypothetical protein LBR16_00945 [Treponema sp.]|jgi:hypothetical protein|nr:hypothetical protein [Treponema sp.]